MSASQPRRGSGASMLIALHPYSPPATSTAPSAKSRGGCARFRRRPVPSTPELTPGSKSPMAARYWARMTSATPERSTAAALSVSSSARVPAASPPDRMASACVAARRVKVTVSLSAPANVALWRSYLPPRSARSRSSMTERSSCSALPPHPRPPSLVRTSWGGYCAWSPRGSEPGPRARRPRAL